LATSPQSWVSPTAPTAYSTACSLPDAWRNSSFGQSLAIEINSFRMLSIFSTTSILGWPIQDFNRGPEFFNMDGPIKNLKPFKYCQNSFFLLLARLSQESGGQNKPTRDALRKSGKLLREMRKFAGSCCRCNNSKYQSK